jgi:hypothetical protein
MKAFYLIHILILTEIVATILLVLKLHDLALKVRAFKCKIKGKTESKIQKLQKNKEFCKSFNYKYENKAQITLNFAKKILKDVLIRSLIGKFVISKSRFVPRMLKSANIVFWFVLSFLLFRSKNA